MTMPGNEIAVVAAKKSYEQAQEAAAGLTSDQMHLAAKRAGIAEWLGSVNHYTLATIGDSTSEALRMPFPSPFTQTIREEAGYPEGVATSGPSRWSLGVGDLDPDAEHDTGVRLVCFRQLDGGNKSSLVGLPLDIVITDYSYRKIHERPDKVTVEIGDRQLPNSSTFHNEAAQGLLIMSATFLGLLASGEAAQLTTELPPPARRGLKRLLPGKN